MVATICNIHEEEMNMANVPFNEKEMTQIGEYIGFASIGSPRTPRYAKPISPKENFKHAIARDGKALWFPMVSESMYVESRANPDHIARAEIRDMGPEQKPEEKGGPDLFGINWTFVPMVGGSMETPGQDLLEDVNDWKDFVKFPDIDALAWDNLKNDAVLNDTDLLLGITFQNGMFERLISFMEFENAAIALIDEDQQDAIHELFDKLADMYIAMIRKYQEVLHVDAVMFHDDWGSQRDPFFSLSTLQEMVCPHIKKISDYCHSQGMIFNHHSCGKNQRAVQAMIDQGDDIWQPQPMNDSDYLISNYGDRMMFGVNLPAVDENISDEEATAIARDIAAKYAPSFYEKPIIIINMRAPQKLTDAIYRESRIALCGRE